MARYLIGLALALALAGPAMAQLSDDQYVTEYFGTTALFITASQLVDPNVGWWGDKLPQQLSYGDYGFVTGVVNTLRNAKGTTPLLDPSAVQIITGWEEPVEGGYQYTIDFIDMRPSEVEAVVNALGGMAKVLPGAELSFRPLLTKSFYNSASSLDGEIVLVIGSETITLRPDTPVQQVKDEISAAFRQQYGKDVDFDLYLSQYIHMDGTSGADISVYAQMAAG